MRNLRGQYPAVQSVQLLDESTAVYCAQRSKHKEIDYRRPTPSLKSNYEDIDPQNITPEPQGNTGNSTPGVAFSIVCEACGVHILQLSHFNW